MANLGIIDTDALAEMNAKIERVLELATKEILTNNKLLLTAEEVGLLTSYDEKTIRRKKWEIGPRNGVDGKSLRDLRFPMKNVLAWVERGCNPPKPLPTHKK